MNNTKKHVSQLCQHCKEKAAYKAINPKTNKKELYCSRCGKFEKQVGQIMNEKRKIELISRLDGLYHRIELDDTPEKITIDCNPKGLMETTIALDIGMYSPDEVKELVEIINEWDYQLHRKEKVQIKEKIEELEKELGIKVNE